MFYSDGCAVHGTDEAAACRETLNMAAALRLPRSMSPAEKEAAADALIRRLGLTGSADTPVGELSPPLFSLVAAVLWKQSSP